MKIIHPLRTSLVLVALISLAAGQSAATAPAPAAKPTPAVAPATPVTPATPALRVDASAGMPKKDTGGFLKRHEGFLARGKAGPVGLLFIGDSITDGWTKAPHIWEAYFGKYEPANFGIGGDQTQHVIWRIENGELEGLHPKVTVLMIGTNNSAGNTAAEIAAADRKIVELIRAKMPETKVLLLAIFPRGARKDKDGKITDAAIADATKRTAAINDVNSELAKLDDGKNVRYLDIAAVFYGQDGKIPFALMPDQLHPTAAGYQLWADAMKPLLTEMLK
ncbi:MAG: GDSL family lipase [Undibacterium sp.]|nr:GDSL family lipase [Opitutaceae bacterium]